MSAPVKLLTATLASVLAELERLDPQSLVAARGRGVLEGVGVSPRAASPIRQGHGGRKPDTDLDERIAALYKGGKTLLVVGREVGRSTAAVTAALHRQGVEVRPKGTRCDRKGVTKHSAEAAERLSRMLKMRAEGATLEDIGLSERITRERVRQLFHRAGVKTSQEDRPLTPEEVAAVARYVAGDSLDQAAESINATATQFRRFLAKSGVAVRPSRRDRRRQPQTLVNAERAAQLYRAGSSIEEISKQLGYAKGSVIYRLLAIAGVKPSRHRNHNGHPVGTEAHQ